MLKMGDTTKTSTNQSQTEAVDPLFVQEATFTDSIFTNTISSIGSVSPITFTGDLIPSASLAYDVGAGGAPWRKIYSQYFNTLGSSSNLVTDPGGTINLDPTLSGTISLGGTVRPSASQLNDLGSATNSWKHFYSKYFTVDATQATMTSELGVSIAILSGADVVMATTAGNVILGIFAGHPSLLPNGNNLADIGSLTKSWRNGYFGTTVFTPAINNAGANINITSSRLQPSATNSTDLGFSTNVWRNGFFGTEVFTPVVTSLSGNLALSGGSSLTLNSNSIVVGDLSNPSTMAPNLSVTTDLGSPTKYFRDVYARSYLSQQAFQANSNYVSAIMERSAGTLSAATMTPISFNSVASGNFFSVNNSNFQVLVKGIYYIQFTSVGDAGGSNNTIFYQVFNTTLGTSMINENIEHTIGTIGGSYLIEKAKVISFTLNVNNILNNFQIRVYRSAVDVTNWRIADGRIALMQAYS